MWERDPSIWGVVRGPKISFPKREASYIVTWTNGSEPCATHEHRSSEQTALPNAHRARPTSAVPLPFAHPPSQPDFPTSRFRLYLRAHTIISRRAVTNFRDWLSLCDNPITWSLVSTGSIRCACLTITAIKEPLRQSRACVPCLRNTHLVSRSPDQIPPPPWWFPFRALVGLFLGAM